ncbi:MAG: hypothetical protein FJ146_04930 [Deltaproteobacteria bacterium]|nr:hypothetical protein [Deltaproteobacteria bacterium]
MVRILRRVYPALAVAPWLMTTGIASADTMARLPSDELEITDDSETNEQLRQHPWIRYVRRFRADHNFALVAGGGRGTYLIESFGALKGARIDSGSAWAKLQYSYHVPLYRGFGYILGSSLGYQYSPREALRPFQPVPMVMFPGILAGLVLNLNPLWRTVVAADVYMARANGITYYDAVDATKTEHISVTLVAYDSLVAIDYFYDLNWGLRLEAHQRAVYYYRPLQQPGDTAVYAADALFRLEDRWYGIGVVYHLL